MYYISDLKKDIIINPKVECPVLGCSNMVERQRTRYLVRDKEYFCPQHGIYISPSTFEYEYETDNLLWYEDEDKRYLTHIQRVKRESRFARERSEDALTWNVFRFLQREELLNQFVSHITRDLTERNELIYWSFSNNENDVWPWLRRARIAFSEHPKKGSEPDLIIETEHSLVLIEVKFTSSNYKSVDRIDKLEKYELNEWYQEVFTIDCHYVAYEQKCYELMRFWLLGTWMATQMQKNLILLNLTPKRIDPDVEVRFGSMIRSGNRHRFLRLTWEQLYCWLEENGDRNQNYDKMLHYLRNKSAGYVEGKLQPAIQLSHPN